MLETNVATAQAVTDNDPHQRKSALDRLADGEAVTTEELQAEHDELVSANARAHLDAAAQAVDTAAQKSASMAMSVAEAQCAATAEANSRIGSTRGRIIG
jgi:hypothetical protein